MDKLFEGWRKYLTESYPTGGPEEEETERMIKQFARARRDAEEEEEDILI
jgi:hypothetical protein